MKKTYLVFIPLLTIALSGCDLLKIHFSPDDFKPNQQGSSEFDYYSPESVIRDFCYYYFGIAVSQTENPSDFTYWGGVSDENYMTQGTARNAAGQYQWEISELNLNVMSSIYDYVSDSIPNYLLPIVEQQVIENPFGNGVPALYSQFITPNDETIFELYLFYQDTSYGPVILEAHSNVNI